jgi:hypothetical protein
MSLWNFSHKPDSDWGEDDSSGKAVQPDHYPNVARPGGGYPEGKGKESDTPCKTCNQNNLVDGRCPLCDWPNSVSEPIKNFPLDPFRDDKAGIRAGSTHSSSEDDYEWEDPVAKGVKRWRDKALANFVMFIAEEIDTDMYETGFQPAFPEGWGNGLYESLHDGDYQRFKNIFEGCIEKYNEAMHKYNKEEAEDPSERIEYIDPDTDPKLVWNYFQKTIVGGRAQKKNKIPMGDRPHILYVITSPVAIKVGITGNGFKTRQQGYKQQNRKQFKNNPEWQWHTNPDELREIPIEGPGGQSTLFFDQQFNPQHLNQFYHTTPYGRNRKIVRSADEQGEIIHYVSPEMKKKTAEVIEARIINWCRDDCMIQTSPIGEQKGKTLPVIKNEQGEEEKVLHMCESIPMANSAGITPDLIAYFIGVMANNGGKAPDLGEYGKEWLQSNFNISDENFDQMFSGEFGQELGLNNQPEASPMLEQGQVQNQEINPNQQTLWNFNELSQEYPQAYPEGYTQEDVDDQESAMKWYELNGRNDKASIRAGSWKFGMPMPRLTAETIFDNIRYKETPQYQQIRDKVDIQSVEDVAKERGREPKKYIIESVEDIFEEPNRNPKKQGLNGWFAKIICNECGAGKDGQPKSFIDLNNINERRCSNCREIEEANRTTVSFWKNYIAEEAKNKNVNYQLMGFENQGGFTPIEELQDDDIMPMTTRKGGRYKAIINCPNHGQTSYMLSNFKSTRGDEKNICGKCTGLNPEKIWNQLPSGEDENGTEFKWLDWDSETESGTLKIYSPNDIVEKNGRDQGIGRFKAINVFCTECCADNQRTEVSTLKNPTCRRCFYKLEELEKMFDSNPEFAKSLQTLAEKKWGNGYASESISSIVNRLQQQFPEFAQLPMLKSEAGANIIVNKFIKGKGFDRGKSIGHYNPTAPGQVYVLQHGQTIKIGITNDINERVKEFRGEGRQFWNPTPKHLQESDKSLENTEYRSPAVDVPGAQQWIKIPATMPAAEAFFTENAQSGIGPTEELGPNNTKVVPTRGFPVQQMALKPENVRPKKRSNEEMNNAYYVSEVIENGYIPQNIEREILNWWHSLGVAADPEFAQFTETITLDPNQVPAELDIASDLSLDLHVFLIQKMINNRGWSTDLLAKFTQDDKEQLLGFFGNDPNKLSKTFNLSVNDEGGYDLGNELGQAIGVSELLTGQELVQFDEQGELKQPQYSEDQPMTYRDIAMKEQIPEALIEKELRDPASSDWQQRPLDEWADLAKPEVPIAESISQMPDLSVQVNVPFSTPDGRTLLLDENGWYWQAYQNQWQRVAKTSDHQGSTNWETWNTKVMIDNEYNHYMQSREMVKNFTPLNEFAIWATQAVIAPHNKQALEDAQEWNDIPYDERPTGREHMSEGGQALTEGFDEIFGMDPRADETASIIDESKVDWPQIYNSIAEDIKESERFDHEEGKHDLLTQMYMTDFTAEELGNLQEETYPWCPICKVEHPDDPGDLTIPSDWTQ